MKQLICVALAAVALLAQGAAAAEKPKVEFKDGDRIVFLGNEFFEREADRGYIETELTTRFPDKNLTFRNLGYSGDTVRADARNLCSGWATFGPADQGFDRLKNVVEHIKPTLVFVAYGMNESFEGPKGVAPFVQGLNSMLDMLKSSSAPGMRIVLISPIRHEDLGPPLPNPTEHNRNIRIFYSDAIEQIAQKRGYAFIDMFDDSDHLSPYRETSDGIHLNAYGYWMAAHVFGGAAGDSERQWHVDLDAQTGKSSAEGTQLKVVDLTASGARFEAHDVMLPLAPPPKGQPDPLDVRTVRVTGLAPGRYVLKSGNETIAIASADQWAQGVQLTADPAEKQEEELRNLIVAKNFDFFNFWRPDNDTYIFGYRKHEQGRNAVEIPKFEPLVAAKEAEIAKLRVPQPHTYVLSPEVQK